MTTPSPTEAADAAPQSSQDKDATVDDQSSPPLSASPQDASSQDDVPQEAAAPLWRFWLLAVGFAHPWCSTNPPRANLFLQHLPQPLSLHD